MAKKKLCPLCNRRLPDRSCPSRGDEICTRCCGMNRTLSECGARCTYYNPAAVIKEVNGVLPIYKVLKSKTKGSYSIIVSRERTDGNLQFIVVLIDAWKMGLKDCFGSNNATKQDFQRNVLAKLGGVKMFTEISLSEALWSIKYGLRIAKEVKTRIPREFEKLKHILGDFDNIKVEGSLYKCFECEKGELPEDVIETIKEVTRHDAKARVCGTPDETMIYFVCDKCRRSG